MRQYAGWLARRKVLATLGGGLFAGAAAVTALPPVASAADVCPPIQVLGVPFLGENQVGDFGWMLNQTSYSDAMFIFNDNEEHFQAFMATKKASANFTQVLPASTLGSGCEAGGGNAKIRPYQCFPRARVAGVPTGHNQEGYTALTAGNARASIDAAVDNVVATAKAAGTRRIYFNASKTDLDVLGTNIFQLGADVNKYIVDQLRAVPGRACP